MAKQQSLNRSQAIRDYLEIHPDAKPLETVAALSEEGITVTTGLVSKIKARAKNSRKGKTRAKPVAAVAETSAVIEKPMKNGGTITLEQVRKVAETVNAMGGYQRMTEILDTIKEVGGPRKFKELAEAMRVPEPDDVRF
jgi:hypothetical protein